MPENYRVTDPVRVIYNISNFAYAAVKLAQTNLRNIVGEMELDQTLTSREKINTQLRRVLDEATDEWGVKVVRVEIQKIEPPTDITNAMSKQMKAERFRIETVFNAIHAGNPDPGLLAIRSLEALEKVADGKATKIFLPSDVGAALAGLGAIGELFRHGPEEPAPATPVPSRPEPPTPSKPPKNTFHP
jgi:regulator of protease activity HflC (stomatin/prohibitin superfamily)